MGIWVGGVVFVTAGKDSNSRVTLLTGISAGVSDGPDPTPREGLATREDARRMAKMVRMTRKIRTGWLSLRIVYCIRQ